MVDIPYTLGKGFFHAESRHHHVGHVLGTDIRCGDNWDTTREELEKQGRQEAGNDRE